MFWCFKQLQRRYHGDLTRMVFHWCRGAFQKCGEMSMNWWLQNCSVIRGFCCPQQFFVRDHNLGLRCWCRYGCVCVCVHGRVSSLSSVLPQVPTNKTSAWDTHIQPGDLREASDLLTECLQRESANHMWSSCTTSPERSVVSCIRSRTPGWKCLPQWNAPHHLYPRWWEPEIQGPLTPARFAMATGLCSYSSHKKKNAPKQRTKCILNLAWLVKLNQPNDLTDNVRTRI